MIYLWLWTLTNRGECGVLMVALISRAARGKYVMCVVEPHVTMT